jgi:hypothetical protein
VSAAPAIDPIKKVFRYEDNRNTPEYKLAALHFKSNSSSALSSLSCRNDDEKDTSAVPEAFPVFSAINNESKYCQDAQFAA